MEVTSKALPEIVNDYFDEFGEIISETTLTSLRDMVEVPNRLLLVRYRGDLGQAYLDAFTPDVRQEYNCRTCLQFLNGIGSIAIITEDDRFMPLAFNAELASVIPVTFKASFDAVCKVFADADATDFEILTTDMVNEYGKFIGAVEAGGYHHFAVDQNQFSYAAVKDILIKHAVDLKTRANGVGKAESASIHQYLQELIKHDFSKLVAVDKLRERDQPIYTEIVQLADAYKTGNRALIVLKHLIESGLRILTLRNSVVGTLLADVMAGKTFAEAYERYKAFVDPRFYKRPVRLPTETQFEESVAFLTEKGYDKLLPLRFASTDEVISISNWVKPTIDQVAVKADVFGAARKAIVKKDEGAKPDLIKHELERISLLSIESILKELAEKGDLCSVELVGNVAFIGSVTSTQDPAAGAIYNDGATLHKFYGSTPLPMKTKNDIFETDDFVADSICFERDDFNNPMISLFKFNTTWKTPLQMTVFPDDLIGELAPHRRVIEHWSRETMMNLDEEGNVIVYDTVPLAMALSVGHGLYVKTKTDLFSFEVTSLR